MAYKNKEDAKKNHEKWRKNNREHLREYQKRWRKKNSKKVKAIHKRHNCKEKTKRRKREWSRKNTVINGGQN